MKKQLTDTFAGYRWEEDGRLNAVVTSPFDEVPANARRWATIREAARIMGCRHEHAYTRLHTQKLPHPWLKVTPKQVRGICVVPVDVLLVDKIEQLKNALMDFGLNAALMAGCPESAETLRELKAILDERINELRKEVKEHEQAA